MEMLAEGGASTTTPWAAMSPPKKPACGLAGKN